MTVNNDFQLNIAVGAGAQSAQWRNTRIKWSELLEKLSHPIVTKETYDAFMRMSREDQQRVKDVGAFVGGYLSGNKRSKGNLLYRQIVALDADFSHKDMWWDFTNLYTCAACLHSTHKSNPDKPRHRLIIPLDREVSADEFQAVARRIAADLGMQHFDKTTFQANRCMFWPSVSSDATYEFEYQDAEPLCVDDVLARYKNWSDATEWAVTYDESDEVILKEAKKQENPLQKRGLIGAFCRTYSIQEAIEKYLWDIYIPTDTENRYTYAQGSTSSGLIIYEDVFAYSHHGTDPASGKLLNAFDLVRLHKFGHLDTGREKETTKSKSFVAMEELVANDEATRRTIATERFEEAKADFAEAYPDATTDEQADDSWTETLKVNLKGEYECTSQNLNIILRNDPNIKDAFALNDFDYKKYVVRSLPWREITFREPLRDVDYSGIHNYIECVYGIHNGMKVDDAVAVEFERHHFHPVREYITAQQWDGIQRVETLLIDFLGADDTPYTRKVTRMTLAAAVARVFEPAIKFDTVLILVGEQGTFKSTIAKRLGGKWFSDTFTTVSGKEAFEQLQGAWIMEIAELSGLKKAEIETIKHFISKSEDTFRPAYGRVVETYKRQCIFIGTTNSKDFLRDPTGNRRFLPVDVHLERAVRSVPDELTEDEVAQIWAEAYQLYIAGEPLYLDAATAATARAEQELHSDLDERAGIIETYLDRLLPDDWATLSIDERRIWLSNPLAKRGEVLRDKVCVAEIWCEALGRDKSDLTQRNAREVNDLMRCLKNWSYCPTPTAFAVYGRQRYYKRKENIL